ncbi:MAG: hypothetical protein F4X54_07145 [Chloroflexi bacterium]|nr:hypothetical protein [Chloroflexota bacterium]
MRALAVRSALVVLWVAVPVRIIDYWMNIDRYTPSAWDTATVVFEGTAAYAALQILLLSILTIGHFQKW